MGRTTTARKVEVTVVVVGLVLLVGFFATLAVSLFLGIG